MSPVEPPHPEYLVREQDGRYTVAPNAPADIAAANERWIRDYESLPGVSDVELLPE